MAFAGTTQKCMACDKTVYLVDKLTADNRVYHKACFRCHHCKGTLKVRTMFVQSCWYKKFDQIKEQKLARSILGTCYITSTNCFYLVSLHI